MGTILLGNIQVEVLKHLQSVKTGISINQLFKFWKYKEGAEKSLKSLEKLGHIKIINSIAYFVSFPKDIEPNANLSNYSPDELKEFENMSRRNLVYMYKEELLSYLWKINKKRKIPEGVKRSLQRLGILKWKILELTELGRKLLIENQTPKLP
jgi:hypothetical protein